jgi:hypothetical protein
LNTTDLSENDFGLLAAIGPVLRHPKPYTIVWVVQSYSKLLQEEVRNGYSREPNAPFVPSTGIAYEAATRRPRPAITMAADMTAG